MPLTTSEPETAVAALGDAPALTTALKPGVSLVTVSVFTSLPPDFSSTSPTPVLRLPKLWFA